MKKGLLNVMIANIICLVINLLTNFLVPKFVSIDSYSMIKTYALYLNYAGFFSAGYNDGMYLQNGGKDLNTIKKKRLADNFFNYIILICLMLVLVLAGGIILNDTIIIAFAFGMFAYNILGYLKSLYQATGEFRAYGRALNIEKFTVFIFTMGLIFVLHTDNYKLFIWVQVIVSILVSVYLFTKLEQKLKFIKLSRFKLSEYKENISSGFILMLGNFSSGIFTGLDRWFVKFLLTSTDFAMFSFAVSMESVINTFISPITVSMYNYFCKDPSVESIKRIKKLTLIWGFIMIAAAFPAKWILENFLQNYIRANNVVFILFAAQVFYVIVKGIYVNVYKAEKKQSLYLKQMIAMIVVGTMLNTVFYLMFKNMVCIAAATLVTAIIWMYMCELRSALLRFGWKENISIMILIVVYLFCGYCMESIIGCIVYCIVLFIVCFVFMNDTIRYVVKLGKKRLHLLKEK
jgi:O-antigen/teichoic acid export membrane protein